MNKHDPAWWAAKILHRLLSGVSACGRTALRQQMGNLLDQQQAIQHCWRRCELAHDYGWHLAAALEQQRLIQLLPAAHSLIEHIAEQQPRRLAQPASPAPPGLRELLAELAQLHQEFDHVVIEPRRRVIAVRTDPITLEETDLGRFQIELHLDRLADRPDSRALDIIALDPNPASASDVVTHPHVSDSVLCAGDAALPLRNALKEGRVCDVFLLTQGVLNTYNPASAYVSLDEWAGVCCAECGDSCHSDELFYCTSCHRDVCENCMGRCDECQDSYCTSCLEREHDTQRNLCRNCRAVCPNCEQVGVASDIEQDGMCRLCREEQECKEHEHEQQIRAAQAPAA